MTDQGPSLNETFEKEAGELGAGVDDGPRYWGTDEGKIGYARREEFKWRGKCLGGINAMHFALTEIQVSHQRHL